MKKHSFLTILFSIIISAQSNKSKPINASEVVYFKIMEIENGTKGLNNGFEINLPNQLVCLSGIYPKDLNLGYFGYVYKPTLDEINLWKNWLEKNEKNLKFDPKVNILGERNILFEYKKGKFRSNYCGK